jgi:hypothetical protein
MMIVHVFVVIDSIPAPTAMWPAGARAGAAAESLLRDVSNDPQLL